MILLGKQSSFYKSSSVELKKFIKISRSIRSNRLTKKLLKTQAGKSALRRQKLAFDLASEMKEINAHVDDNGNVTKNLYKG